MVADLFPMHHRSEALLAVDAAHLDDHRRLASHMEKQALMTAGYAAWCTRRTASDACAAFGALDAR
jgi:hypothetical protein